MTAVQEATESDLMAAIDLGSNSFHMVVARPDHGEWRIIESLSEKVQLAAGFDERGRLTEQVQERALTCLARFAQHLGAVAPGNRRVVGTNALRVAKNAVSFVRRAERQLGCPIEIIAGREEARLIYLGVANTQPAQGRRLVVDIGGGATEFIIGDGYEPLLLESLHMGSISYQRRFFGDGHIDAASMDSAILSARYELMPIAASYRAQGWDQALGSSGTIKALLGVLQGLGLQTTDTIDLPSLLELRARLLAFQHAVHIDFPGIKDDRKPLLASGLAITLGFFEELGIERMHYVDGALREGVLFEMIGRHGQTIDVRKRTIRAMQARYHVDVEQARRVRQTALQLAAMLPPEFASNLDTSALVHAADLHEVGLDVAHSGFHKHGAYLLRYSDMAGFSRTEQERLALLVGAHRRKLREEQGLALLDHGGEGLLLTAVLLRLAVLLNHARQNLTTPPPWQLQVQAARRLHLNFSRAWLDKHPLTLMDLQQEAGHLVSIEIDLSFS